MTITRTQGIYTIVGTVGIYLAHWIWYKRNEQEYNSDHVNALAFYWAIGAIVYWVLLNRSGYKI